jgi:hypothetical protein
MIPISELFEIVTKKWGGAFGSGAEEKVGKVGWQQAWVPTGVAKHAQTTRECPQTNWEIGSYRWAREGDVACRNALQDSLGGSVPHCGRIFGNLLDRYFMSRGPTC